MDSTNLAENFSPVAGIVEFIGWHITGLEPKMTGATRGPQVATFRSFRFSINLVRMAQDGSAYQRFVYRVAHARNPGTAP